jgi:hypothetical protein
MGLGHCENRQALGLGETIQFPLLGPTNISKRETASVARVSYLFDAGLTEGGC